MLVRDKRSTREFEWSTFSLTLCFIRRVYGEKNHTEVNVICAHENMVNLLFIIPAENLELRYMTTKDNEQE